MTEHLDGTLFRMPQGVHVDAGRGEVFVADSGNGLIGIFDAAGTPLFAFTPGTRRDAPQAVTTDAEGNIYVLLGGAGVVRVFDYRGEPLRDLALDVEGTRLFPTGMAMGPGGRLHVLDGRGARIVVFEPAGAVARVIRDTTGRRDRLRAPFDLAVDQEGNLYVTDREGTPVQVYDPQGTYLRGWGKRDIGFADFSTPSGICLDSAGLVYVADALRQDVKIFDRDGNFVERFGGQGEGPGRMAYPTDVAADAQGRLYVVERVGRRLQIFRRVSTMPAPDRAPGAIPRAARSGGSR